MTAMNDAKAGRTQPVPRDRYCIILDNLQQGDRQIDVCLLNDNPASMLNPLPPAQLVDRSTEIPNPASPGTLLLMLP